MKQPAYYHLTSLLLALLVISCAEPNDRGLDEGSPAAGTFTDSRDGQTYDWVRIGQQTWMAENLRYLPQVARPASGSATRPFFYVYGYDGTNVGKAKATANHQNYGVLYNWMAATAGGSSSRSNPSGLQGVCPPGWHLPSHAEWNKLISYVAAQGFPNENKPDGAGNALKSCRQVSSPLEDSCATTQHPRWRANDHHHGFDAFGFSALPGGYRTYDGRFIWLNRFGLWWSSTEYASPTAWSIYIRAEHGNAHRNENYVKSNGLSVRCIKSQK